MTAEYRPDMIGLIEFTSKLRWAALVVGPVLAFAATPPPISVGGVLGLTALMLTYNLLGLRVRHLRPEWVGKLALALVVGDFVVISGVVLLLGNAPSGSTMPLLAVVGFEVGVTYRWRGALAFAAAFVLVLATLVVERQLLFGFPIDPDVVLVQATVNLLVAALAAGTAGVLGRQRLALAEVNERLTSSEAQVRAVLNATAIGICRVGLDGIIQACNPTLAAMLGYATDKLPAHSLRDLADPGDKAEIAALYEELRRGSKSSIAIEARLHRRDGETVWASLSVSLVKDHAGEAQYFVAAIQDIGERKRTEAAQQEAMRALEKLNSSQRSFVSVVSHEFRTALMGIMGFAELIGEENISAKEVQEFAADIVRDSERLNRMVTEVLDFDRMEAGKMPVPLAPIDINDLLRDAVEHAIASSPKHSFRLELDQGLPPLAANKDRLTQVMANLLSNAIKYSPDGSEILVSSRREDDNARVSVRNSGVGIPAHSLQQIFERYSRLDNDATRHVGGTGLGLSIVKEIVKLHGGEVWVESEPGHGSTFHFTLPLHLASEIYPPLGTRATA